MRIFSMALFLLVAVIEPATSLSVGMAAQAVQRHTAHRSGFVQSGGARLHYTSFGTVGSWIVLLPGFSLTAHVFDEIGSQLSNNHRVVALTPRGFGESDAPDSSVYTIETLVGDLRVLLDSLHIDRTALVAHSISGTVASHFALRYPTRISQLILLDAFPYFGAAGGDSISALDRVLVPAFSGDTTYDAAATYLAKYRYVPWNIAMDADLRAKPLGQENARRRALTVPYIADQWKKPPDLRQLRVSALEVCADVSVASEYPWLPESDAQFARATDYVVNQLAPFNKQLCQRFKDTVPDGQTMNLAGSHYVFFTQPQQTVQIVRQFLDSSRRE